MINKSTVLNWRDLKWVERTLSSNLPKGSLPMRVWTYENVIKQGVGGNWQRLIVEYVVNGKQQRSDFPIGGWNRRGSFIDV